MKKLLLTVLVAVIAILASHAEGVSGKWKTSMKGSQGDMEISFIFKVDGTKLTGTASTPMGDVKLSNGKVNGNDFSFDIDIEGNAMSHKGKLEGKVIKLKVEMPDGAQGSSGGPGEMILKKVEE